MAVKKKKETTIDDLALMIGKGFQQVDERFKQIDKRFDQVENRLASLESGQDDIKKQAGQYRLPL